MNGQTQSVTLESVSTRHRWWFWAAIGVLSLLLHILLFTSRPLFWVPFARPPRIDVQQIDPAQLDKIRRQWKESGTFALGKDTPESAEPAPDAKFLSDKNRQVEKERKARNTTVQPVPGDASKRGPEGGSKKKAQRIRDRSRPLSQFGVPLNLEKQADPESPSEAPNQQAGVGADQYIDEDLPEGDRNVLNTRESVYYSFYARMYDKAGAFWTSLTNSMRIPTNTPQGNYVATVDVVMNDDGDIIDLQFVKKSGLEPLDEVVREVWKKVKKIPNPPRGLLDQRGQVQIRWNFHMDLSNASALRYMPPERLE